LIATTLEEVVVDHCPHNCGTFLDKGEIKNAVHPILDEKIWLNDQSAKSLGDSKLFSPAEKLSVMEKFSLASNPPLIVDRCKSTGGIWLDDGECVKLYKVVLQMGQKRDKKSTLTKNARDETVGRYLFQLFSNLPLEVWHPTRRSPVITYSFISLIVLFFLVQLNATTAQSGWLDLYTPLLDNSSWLYYMVLHPNCFEKFYIWQFLTHGLLHADIIHFLGNIFMLYLYGDNVEDIIGKKNFIKIILLSTISGGIFQCLLDSNYVIGISGGVAGVMGAYLILFPKVHLRFFFLFVILRFPAWVTIAFWLCLQLFGIISGEMTIAWFAHLGGFICGILLIFTLGGYKSIKQRIKT
jgi:membrane associated rhomboid family serine protease